MSQSPETVRRAGFNHSVHGARGLFAFLVFVFHVVNSGLATVPVLTTPFAQFVLRTPEYGVELFFCISGYVIVGTLRRASGPLAFLEDRAIRIYPVLWASILTIVALGLATGVRGFADVGLRALAIALPINMMALPGVLPMENVHPAAWSLSFEMAFYCFCAGCWAVRSRLGAAMPWLAGAVATVFVVFYPRAAYFAVGALVGQGWPRHPAMVRLTRYPLVWLALFLGSWRLVQVLSLPVHIAETTLLQWAMDLRLPVGVVAVIAATMAFRGIADGHGLLGRVLRSRVLQFMGTISYSFYLWHPIAMSGVKTALMRSGLAQAAGDGAQALFFVTALVPSLLVAVASQVVLERRVSVALRRRLHHSPPAQPASLEPAMERT